MSIPRAFAPRRAESSGPYAELSRICSRCSSVRPERAIEERAKWVQLLGQMPSDPTHRAAWLANVATIAAYRERWNITGNAVIGKKECVDSIEQLGQWRRASSAVKAVVRLGNTESAGDNSGSIMDVHHGAAKTSKEEMHNRRPG